MFESLNGMSRRALTRKKSAIAVQKSSITTSIIPLANKRKDNRFFSNKQRIRYFSTSIDPRDDFEADNEKLINLEIYQNSEKSDCSLQNHIGIINSKNLLQVQLNDIINNPQCGEKNESSLFFINICQAIQNNTNESIFLEKLKKEWGNLKNDITKDEIAILKDKKYGYTLLHICAGKGWWSVYAFLKSHGFSETLNDQNFYPTHVAVAMNQLNFYEKALKARPDLRTIEVNINGAKFVWDELCIAIANNNILIAKAIFKNISAKKIKFNINEWGSLLHIAIASSTAEKHIDNLMLIEFIIDQQYADIKYIENMFMTRDRERHTILAAAAEQGKLWIVDYLYNLILSDVNIAAGSAILQDALWRAAIKKRVDVVHYFLSCGLIPNLLHPTYKDFSTRSDKSTRIVNLIDHYAEQHYLHGKTPPDPKTVTYENIVFQGGGMKGAIYPYALYAFINYTELRAKDYEKEGGDKIKTETLKEKHIKRVFGTSAGSSFALGVALNFSITILKDEMNKDFSELLSDKSFITIVNNDNFLVNKAKLVLKNFNGNAFEALKKLESLYYQYQNARYFIEKGKLVYEAAKSYSEIKTSLTTLVKQLKEINNSFDGYDDGRKIYLWLQGLLERNGFSKDITFGELAELAKKGKAKHLYVAVTNLRTGKSMVISSEDPRYEGYRILDAIRSSMSIPFVFKPHQLYVKSPDGGFARLPDYYVDGGILYNYGIDYFDRKLYTDNSSPGDSMFPEFNPHVIGFRFKPHFHLLKDNAELKDYIIHFMMIYSQAENFINLFKNTEYHRSIELDTGNVGTLTFRKLDDKELKILEQNATKAVDSYFKNEQNNFVSNFEQEEKRRESEEDENIIIETPPKTSKYKKLALLLFAFGVFSVAYNMKKNTLSEQAVKDLKIIEESFTNGTIPQKEIELFNDLKRLIQMGINDEELHDVYIDILKKLNSADALDSPASKFKGVLEKTIKGIKDGSVVVIKANKERKQNFLISPQNNVNIQTNTLKSPEKETEKSKSRVDESPVADSGVKSFVGNSLEPDAGWSGQKKSALRDSDPNGDVEVSFEVSRAAIPRNHLEDTSKKPNKEPQEVKSALKRIARKDLKKIKDGFSTFTQAEEIKLYEKLENAVEYGMSNENLYKLYKDIYKILDGWSVYGGPFKNVIGQTIKNIENGSITLKNKHGEVSTPILKISLHNESRRDLRKIKDGFNKNTQAEEIKLYEKLETAIEYDINDEKLYELYKDIFKTLDAWYFHGKPFKNFIGQTIKNIENGSVTLKSTKKIIANEEKIQKEQAIRDLIKIKNGFSTFTQTEEIKLYEKLETAIEYGISDENLYRLYKDIHKILDGWYIYGGPFKNVIAQTIKDVEQESQKKNTESDMESHKQRLKM